MPNDDRDRSPLSRSDEGSCSPFSLTNVKTPLSRPDEGSYSPFSLTSDEESCSPFSLASAETEMNGAAANDEEDGPPMSRPDGEEIWGNP